MFYSFNHILGVHVADDYKPAELLINENLYVPTNADTFSALPMKLNIEYLPARTEDCREVAKGFYCKEYVFVDQEFGVRIERRSENEITIKSEQQCNEWLTIFTELLILKQNHTLIHAAALEKGNRCLLLPSWGGVGKTASVVKLVETYGWRLLGDDLVVLDGNSGSVKCHLKDFVIYGYHKNLFPQFFASGKAPALSGRLSQMLSMAIPAVKRYMRHVPALLSFARRHNPQSKRVSPKEIFKENQIGSTAERVKQVIWLERTLDDSVKTQACSAQSIASHTAAVSLSEIFSDRARCAYYLCACGVIDYEDVFARIFNIINACISDSNISMLYIPKDVIIDDVGDIVASQLV